MRCRSALFPGVARRKHLLDGLLLGTVERLVVGRARLDQVGRHNWLSEASLISWLLRQCGREVLDWIAHRSIGIWKLVCVCIERIALDVGGRHLHRAVELVWVLLKTGGGQWQGNIVRRKLFHERALNAASLVLQAGRHIRLEFLLWLLLGNLFIYLFFLYLLCCFL